MKGFGHLNPSFLIPSDMSGIPTVIVGPLWIYQRNWNVERSKSMLTETRDKNSPVTTQLHAVHLQPWGWTAHAPIHSAHQGLGAPRQQRDGETKVSFLGTFTVWWNLFFMNEKAPDDVIGSHFEDLSLFYLCTDVPVLSGKYWPSWFY